MRVNVLFFGRTAELANARTAVLEAADNSPVGSVLDQLCGQFPGLADSRLLVSVNQEYADAASIVRDGDEIAIFTAVSGG